MTMGIDTTSRNAILNQLVTDAGSGALLSFYTGTRPATGAALSGNTLLSQHTCSSTLGTVSGGVLTLNAVGSATAGNTGTATWARLTTSGGTFVADFSVTASGGGGDITINNTSISSGGTVTITASGTLTAGNP